MVPRPCLIRVMCAPTQVTSLVARTALQPPLNLCLYVCRCSRLACAQPGLRHLRQAVCGWISPPPSCGTAECTSSVSCTHNPSPWLIACSLCARLWLGSCLFAQLLLQPLLDSFALLYSWLQARWSQPAHLSIPSLLPFLPALHAADAVKQAFRGAADDAASGSEFAWAELRLQVTAADPSSGEQRMFELTFGTLGRDGLPVMVRLPA